MRSYDLVYIVRPDLEPDALKALIDRITRRVQDQGAKVEAVIPWGKRRMSFAIGKHREGVYVHARLQIDPRNVAEVRRLVSMTEDVLRAVVTTAVGKLPEPGTAAAPAAVSAASPTAPAAAGGPARSTEA